MKRLSVSVPEDLYENIGDQTYNEALTTYSQFKGIQFDDLDNLYKNIKQIDKLSDLKIDIVKDEINFIGE